MNNKGQTLVLFVVLLPIILILFAFVFDYSYIAIKNSQLESVAKSSLKSVMVNNANYEKVVNTIKMNDSNITVVAIDKNSIYLTNEIEPIFGQVIGFKKYDLKVQMVGKYKGDKLIIEEKGK